MQNKCDCPGGQAEYDHLLDAAIRHVSADICPPPTVETLTSELAAAQRRVSAVESVLLALIAQEFDGDARRMAREILDLRMALGAAQCLR